MNRIACILFFVLVSATAFSKTIRVGRQHAFTSIKQAIAYAAKGDTILVGPGLYREKNLVIDKPVLLKGIGLPVLDGEKKYEVVSIKSNGVVIEGFKIVRSGNSSIDDLAGIKIYKCNNVTVRSNILDDNAFGIYSLYSVNCTIEKNELRSYGTAELQSGNGIHCWRSDSMRIIANNVSGHRDGIYFEFVTNSVIWRNQSHNNIRYGLHFMFSNDDAYIANVFQKNGSGVAVMYSHGVKMFHNYFEDNWGDAAYGLLLKEISNSYIQGNYFLRNTSGIYMEGTTRISVQRNTFKGNGWAMKIQASCMENEVTGNNFLSNSFDVGTNGSLVLNKFDRNYWDKYEGYDLNRDNTGDVPYRPVSLYSMIVEKNPASMMLFRSLMAGLLDKSEKIIPTLTPENLKDNYPIMKPLRQ